MNFPYSFNIDIIIRGAVSLRLRRSMGHHLLERYRHCSSAQGGIERLIVRHSHCVKAHHVTIRAAFVLILDPIKKAVHEQSTLVCAQSTRSV